MNRWLLLSVAIVATTSVRGQEPLTLVPADAAVFAHLDVSKVLASELGKSLQNIVVPREQDDFDRKPGTPKTPLMKPYPEFRTKFKSLTGIDLEDVTTLTMYVPKMKGPGDEQTIVVALTLKKEYDQVKLLKGLGEMDDFYKKAKPAGPGIVEFRPEGMRLGFPNDKTIYIMGGQVKSLPTAVADQKGVIAPALTAARSGTAGVLSLNFANFPEEIKGDDLPAEARPFAPLIKSDLNYATFDLKDDTVKATVHVFNSEKAKTIDAEKSLQALMTFAKTGLAVVQSQLESNSKNDKSLEPILAMVKSLRESVKTARYESTDTEARLSVSLKADPGITGSVLRMVNSMGMSSSRAITQNNMKQIGLAFHNYESAYGHFPAAAICDKKGKPLLSWRVAILPFIEQDALYKQFKLDEPWDSEHNIKLADYVVKVYTIPGQDDMKKTHYRVFTGGDDKIFAGFNMTKPFKITDVTDGTSNTIMTALSKDAVVWTKPDDLVLDLKKNPADLLLFQNDVTQVGMMDGSVRAVRKGLPAEMWRAFITRNGGEVAAFP